MVERATRESPDEWKRRLWEDLQERHLRAQPAIDAHAGFITAKDMAHYLDLPEDEVKLVDGNFEWHPKPPLVKISCTIREVGSG